VTNNVDEQYEHNWLGYMPPKALALTAVSIFHGEWRTEVGLPHWWEKIDAMQILFDELRERVGKYEAEDMIFHAPGMDQDLTNEFMELVE